MLDKTRSTAVPHVFPYPCSICSVSVLYPFRIYSKSILYLFCTVLFPFRSVSVPSVSLSELVYKNKGFGTRLQGCSQGISDTHLHFMKWVNSCFKQEYKKETYISRWKCESNYSKISGEDGIETSWPVVSFSETIQSGGWSVYLLKERKKYM